VLVIKSTVPVGTGEEVAARIRAAGVEDVDVVSNPEFLRQSSAVKDFFCPDRVVVGSSSIAAARAVEALYESLDCPTIVCSHRSAELGKYAANSYLATRISFINEMAGICEATGADIGEVSIALGLDHRVGRHYLQPGLGYGGSCLPKDVMALRSTASMFGYTPRILEAVEETNQRLPEIALGKLMSAAGLRPGSTVGVLGLAFKPNTDDIRGAPAVRVIRHLLDMGCQVKAHDPMAMATVSQLHPEVHFCQNVYEVSEDADALVLATEWREYIEAEWGVIRERMRGRTVLDGRHALDSATLVELGFNYLSLGRHLSGSVLELVNDEPVVAMSEIVTPLSQNLKAG
jgi:UDPglucose 6-dehydrogenase